MELENLEYELNNAHRQYILISSKFDVKSNEYKEAKKKYFDLIDEYSIAYQKYLNKEVKKIRTK